MPAYSRIVVLGGGSSGWMTAAALASALPDCRIELIESEEIGIIGVGEATFPSIRNYNRLLKIDESEFLQATHGTYKLGIQFCDWSLPGESYFHTFGDFGALDGPMALWGQYRRLQSSAGDALGDWCLPTVMAQQGRFCVPESGDGLASRYDYAYQFDATLYAAYLRRLAERRGVRRTEGRVSHAERRADGGIQRLKLADGQEIEGDLFIDCSGFSSFLMGQTLGEPFIDYSHWLPVNGAWAVPVERQGEALTPYTRSTALDSGWVWRIPLQDRTGYGHVFSSRFVDPERAREQLLEQVDGRTLAEPRLIRFTTGHRARSWANNVIAIGLSCGFLEPLESTAIYLVQAAVGHLIPLLQAHTQAQPPAETIEFFNGQQNRLFQRIRDFIILHYRLSRRRDSDLWRYMTSMELPESLTYKIHTWRETGILSTFDDEGFDATSWLAIHAGMGHWPQRSSPWMNEVPQPLAEQYLQQRRAAIADLVARMPAHDRYLRQVTGR